MGLHGDDEDDLAADAESCLAAIAAIDLVVDIHGLPQGQTSQPAGFESVSTGAASGSGGSKKSRSSTSKA
jgi:hypothetical protein